MVGHKSKKRNRENGLEISSSQDLVSRIGGTRSRIGIETELDDKSEWTKSFIRHAGRVSDRVYDSKKRKLLNLAGAAAVAYMAISPVAFAGQAVNEPGYSQHDITVLTKFMKSNAKYSAKGESVTNGRATEEIVGIVDINRLKGYSSEMLNGGRTVNGASVQLNTYVHLISGNGKGQWLWVQNGIQVFIKGDRKFETPLYTYGSVSEIFKDSIRFDAQAAEGKTVTQQEFNSLKLSGLSGKGKITKSSGIVPTYLYPDYSSGKENGRWTISGGDTQSSRVIRFALDIRVAEKQDIVYLNFGIAPLKNYKPDWKKEVVFDTVSYKMHGLRSAKIEFDKLHDTGLVVTGIGGGSYFHAKEISGYVGVEEKNKGRLVPMAVGGNADWSTGESTVGVRSVKLNSYAVELVTAKNGSAATQ